MRKAVVRLLLQVLAAPTRPAQTTIAACQTESRPTRCLQILRSADAAWRMPKYGAPGALHSPRNIR